MEKQYDEKENSKTEQEEELVEEQNDDEDEEESSEASNDTTEETSEGSDDEVDYKAKYKELEKKAKDLEEKNKQLYARTKKTEKKTKKPNSEQVDYSELREETRLIAQGLPDEDVELLREIKDFKGLDSLKEAQESEFYKARLQQRESEKKEEKTNLNASKIKGTGKKGETTEADLKKAWLGK